MNNYLDYLNTPISAWWTLFGFTIGVVAGRFIPRRRPRAVTTDNDVVELYVGNLSYDMTDVQLRKEFERFGAVKSARVIENRFNHKSKGFGFVEMPNRSEAEAAIKTMHDRDIMGRKLRVNEAKNKTHE